MNDFVAFLVSCSFREMKGRWSLKVYLLILLESGIGGSEISGTGPGAWGDIGSAKLQGLISDVLAVKPCRAKRGDVNTDPLSELKMDPTPKSHNFEDRPTNSLLPAIFLPRYLFWGPLWSPLLRLLCSRLYVLSMLPLISTRHTTKIRHWGRI